MDAKVVQRVQLSTTWIDANKVMRKKSGSVRLSGKLKEQQRLQVIASAQFQPMRNKMWNNRSMALEASCCYKNFPASTLQSESLHIPLDVDSILKKKSQEIQPCLNGRCIYLVGMMGSGKTTVGKIVSKFLDYSFYDCDTLVEHDMDGTSVAEIFKLHGEGFFRDKETEALQKLCKMHRLVVSTGGGAVVRPINWQYMQKGISVWLDVPLEALARRIAAVGTDSRPLLDHESGDAYTKAFRRLTTIFEERGEAYARANAKVSLENIAAKLGDIDVSSLSPTIIALEALEQIENYLKEEGGMA